MHAAIALALMAHLNRTVAGVWLELDAVRAFGGKRRRGEEWEGLHCWDTERERENQHWQLHVEIVTIIVISICHPYGLACPSVSA